MANAAQKARQCRGSQEARSRAYGNDGEVQANVAHRFPSSVTGRRRRRGSGGARRRQQVCCTRRPHPRPLHTSCAHVLRGRLSGMGGGGGAPCPSLPRWKTHDAFDRTAGLRPPRGSRTAIPRRTFVRGHSHGLNLQLVKPRRMLQALGINGKRVRAPGGRAESDRAQQAAPPRTSASLPERVEHKVAKRHGAGCSCTAAAALRRRPKPPSRTRR